MRALGSPAPKQWRSAVRHGVLDPMQRAWGDWRFRQAVSRLRRLGRTDRPTLAAMRHAWGNEAYSADLAYVQEVADRAVRCRHCILECGSGLTTIVAGVLSEKRQVRVLSLEQDQAWAMRVDAAVMRNRIANTRVVFAELCPYDGFAWYDVSGVELPGKIDLVICDGPAIFPHWGDLHAQWRYGVLAVLASKGIEVGEVLLDDASEPRAASVLSRWQEEFGFEHTLLQSAEGDSALCRDFRRPHA